MRTKKRQFLIAVALLLTVTSLAFGQQQPRFSKELQEKFGGLVDSLKAGAKKSAQERTIQVQTEFSFGEAFDLIALALVAADSQKFQMDIEEARVDKQVGGAATNSGATTLVSKGSTPSILGYAVEHGALTRMVNGTTITFRGNPVGIIEALGKAGFFESYSDDDSSTRFLRKLSFAFSFDTTRGDQPGTFTGDLNQLSSWGLRFDIQNKRDPRHHTYAKKWHDLIVGSGQALTQDHADLLLLIKKGKQLDGWLATAQIALAKAKEEEIEKVLEQQLFVELPKVPLTNEEKALVRSLAKNVGDFLVGRDTLLAAVANGAIVTFEYTNTRKVTDPDLSNFKLIAEGSFFHGRADLTANASVTILNKIPAGAKLDRFQDVDLSGQLDVPLGEVQKIGSVVLSFSGKYKHMMQDTMMASGMMADTKGDMGVGQVKLTIPVKGSGVKIPLSFTFANRTELVKEKFVHGNIGITFDLDSIFGRLKP